MMGQSETLNSSYIFSAGAHSAAAPRTSHGNLPNYAEPKPFCWIKPVHVRFSSSIFTVQDHILSTSGDDVTHYQKKQNLTTCIITVVSWWVLVHSVAPFQDSSPCEHPNPAGPQWTSNHQRTIQHWMSAMTQFCMNLNWVNIWFHLGNQFCRKWVSYSLEADR